MLLKESDRAKAIRSRLLDIVMDVLAERAGGQTKYINQRDERYLTAAFQESSYRKQFTDALDQWVEGNHWKYARFTNLIYRSIFQENATEYRKVLKLAAQDNIRETMYAEVLNLISSYEAGIAHELETASNQLKRKLTQKEAENLFAQFERHPLFQPLILDARIQSEARITRLSNKRRVLREVVEQSISTERHNSVINARNRWFVSPCFLQLRE